MFGTNKEALCNSYTMVCPPVRGDNPRALVSGSSPIQVDNHGIILLFTTYISVDIAHYEIFCAKVGKGSKKHVNFFDMV